MFVLLPSCCLQCLWLAQCYVQWRRSSTLLCVFRVWTATAVTQRPPVAQWARLRPPSHLWSQVLELHHRPVAEAILGQLVAVLEHIARLLALLGRQREALPRGVVLLGLGVVLLLELCHGVLRCCFEGTAVLLLLLLLWTPADLLYTKPASQPPPFAPRLLLLVGWGLRSLAVAAYLRVHLQLCKRLATATLQVDRDGSHPAVLRKVL